MLLFVKAGFVQLNKKPALSAGLGDNGRLGGARTRPHSIVRMTGRYQEAIN